ncbi:tachykinin family protein [Xylaria bambusicola]|uniref:tachykinin family protein n=1 Tax=Xylaria bambusicola TaxID=326684 RepID=UPI0020078237|nr:tachykinin family protein [Xylaria bambusicola]KAI0525963.1 tachykinin family protein [Xylaria bambusicola]
MSSSEAGDTPVSYTFVTENNSGEGRSHAIRAHWRQRRQRIEMQRREREAQEQRPPRQILPGPRNSSESSRMSPMPPTSDSHPPLHEHFGADRENSTSGSSGHLTSTLEGIPAQALSRMNIALGSSRWDPFDRFPVQLTTRHHRLLHHWLSTFAGMMFNMHTSDFNPMRDVWLPLDLSNAASFNAIMAHSAAHLARMQGFPVSNEAVQFKIEAVGIVQCWARDPGLALSDDTIAAILRLLSFERYWGSEVEWRIHRNGLLEIIEARGGITTLQSNWRLEITTFLVMLMARPSWFDSSNQLREISQQPMSAHPVLGHLGNLHKTRCLWLLSFIQDMRTFMGNSPEIYNHGLAHYTSIRDALLVVKSDLYLHDEDLLAEDDINERERTRLACLFYICVMLQGCVSHSDAGNPVPLDFYHSYSITSFNQCLARNYGEWQGSIQNLYECLFHGTIAAQTPTSRLRYALDLTDTLSSMSAESRRGVEKCMLQILYQALTDGRTTMDYDCTLDSLLACIEGH